MKKIKVGLIGAGNIGAGVVEAVKDNGGLIASRTGIEISLAYVCDIDKNKLAAIDDIPGLIKTGDYKEVINSEDVDIVVELIGGISPAKEIILGAVKNKKHVVTANKALLSEHFREIFSAAEKEKVHVNFEASVGGGIPVIKTVMESFVANDIELVYGILNGTSNFILSKMEKDNCSFGDALKEAQAKGLAESDPSLDINGKDTAHKLAILASLGFGIEVLPSDIHTQGIEKITLQDISAAKGWGYSIKLLAVGKKKGDQVELRVHSCLVPSFHLLSGVKGENNAIFIRGDFVGESLLFGKGAGPRPTSSAIMSDVVEIALSDDDSGESGWYENLFANSGKLSVKKSEDLELSFYLRFSVIDRPGVLASISKILSENGISIAGMNQEERKEGESVPVIMLTHRAKHGDLEKAILEIDKLDFVSDETVVIHVEG